MTIEIHRASSYVRPESPLPFPPPHLPKDVWEPEFGPFHDDDSDEEYHEEYFLDLGADEDALWDVEMGDTTRGCKTESNLSPPPRTWNSKSVISNIISLTPEDWMEIFRLLACLGLLIAFWRVATTGEKGWSL